MLNLYIIFDSISTEEWDLQLRLKSDLGRLRAKETVGEVRKS